MPSGATPAASTERPRHVSSRTVFRALGITAAASLLWLSLRQVEMHRVATLLGGLGPFSALLLVPSVVSLGLETFAWKKAFLLVGSRPTFFGLIRVRVASESLGVTLPLGALWADAVKPRLLSRGCNTPVSVNLVGIAARKYLLVLSQAAYLVLGFALGRALLGAAFERALGARSLAALALGGAVGLALLAEGMALSLRGGATFRAILRRAALFPSARLRKRLDRWQHEMHRTDQTAVRFFGASPWVRGALAVPCLAGWLFEATETWTMLHVLGSSLSWGDAVAVEAVVVFARNALVILPGGLGAQELGYATLLGAAGVDVSISAALMVLKRLREACWATLGGVLLAAGAAAREKPARAVAVSY